MPFNESLKGAIRSICPVLPIETPIITTPRLIIRPLLQSDLAIYHKIRTSPAVMRYLQLQRPDVDIAFAKTKLDPSLPPQNRADGTLTYLLGVEEQLNRPGVLIGDTGCHYANPGPEEVGYMLLDEFWGKGCY
jgi:RimJ/RimL family protein N-acetyltransferase